LDPKLGEASGGGSAAPRRSSGVAPVARVAVSCGALGEAALGGCLRKGTEIRV